MRCRFSFREFGQIAMPISVTCRCQAKFAAPDKLAGKRVKCPKCQQALLIPGQRLPSEAAAARKPASATPVPTSSENTPAADAPPCPACKQPFPPEKVVCTNCAYSRRLKRRIKSAATPTTPKPAATKEKKPKKAKLRKRAPSRFDGGKVIVGLGIMFFSLIGFFALLGVGFIVALPVLTFFSGFGMVLNGLFGETPLGGD